MTQHWPQREQAWGTTGRRARLLAPFVLRPRPSTRLFPASRCQAPGWAGQEAQGPASAGGKRSPVKEIELHPPSPLPGFLPHSQENGMGVPFQASYFFLTTKWQTFLQGLEVE